MTAVAPLAINKLETALLLTVPLAVLTVSALGMRVNVLAESALGKRVKVLAESALGKRVKVLLGALMAALLIPKGVTRLLVRVGLDGSPIKPICGNPAWAKLAASAVGAKSPNKA